MPEPTLIVALAAFAGLVVVTLGALKGWQDWLALKQRELDSHAAPGHFSGGSPSAASRIEISDLKERIRKLEAIASGVDL